MPNSVLNGFKDHFLKVLDHEYYFMLIKVSLFKFILITINSNNISDINIILNSIKGYF